MDYSNYRCPVCEKPFLKDDEIVVCPECGAPHHRECYDAENRCFFEDKHKENFDFKAYAAQQSNGYNNNSYQNNESFNGTNQQGGEIIPCLNCGTFNVSTNDVCQNCGAPLDKTNRYTHYDRHASEAQTPPPAKEKPSDNPFSASFVFDPMGGLQPEEDLGAGVTASEVSKFTKNNSPFFCRLFKQIKDTNRSRFSFVGFIFGGGWLLYRKMYKLGIFITSLMALMIISRLYIQTFYADLIENFAKLAENTDYNVIIEAFKSFYHQIDTEDKLVLSVYVLAYFGRIALSIICAICGNNWYYKHCINTISKIKTQSGTKESADSLIESKGGVNGTLATCLLITGALLSFLPYFF
ncbi:MAG: DUF2628 domain-containing protein [Ruminococcaceae bacterium]|nr:DUF2628 domain-containing protein [Oscillospiraceae bacterium]